MDEPLRRHLSAAVAVGVFVAAWHYALWLLVIGMTAMAAMRAVGEQLDERLLAQRTATLAMFAPYGIVPAGGLELTIAANLAAAASGDSRVLEAVAVHVEKTIDDPWLRALAVERLRRAMEIASSGRLPPSSRGLRLLADQVTRRTTAATVAALVVIAPATRDHRYLVALAVCLTVLGTGVGEARRRDRLPAMLGSEAATLPPEHGFILLPEPVVIGALQSLAASSPRVLTRAAALTDLRTGPDRVLARSRLTHAANAPCNRRPQRFAATVLIWAAVAAIAIVSLEAR